MKDPSLWLMLFGLVLTIVWVTWAVIKARRARQKLERSMEALDRAMEELTQATESLRAMVGAKSQEPPQKPGMVVRRNRGFKR